MSSIISSENYVEHALKMSSANRDWRFNKLICLFTISLGLLRMETGKKTRGGLVSLYMTCKEIMVSLDRHLILQQCAVMTEMLMTGMLKLNLVLCQGELLHL